MNVIQLEWADGRTMQTILVGTEHCMEYGIIITGFVHILDFIEEEGKVSRDGAIETSFQESCPVLQQNVFASSVFLADPSNSEMEKKSW